MKYQPGIHRRRSIRLPNHDYSSAGFYFITTCAYHRQCLFGEITAGRMQLNNLGQIVEKEWQRSQEIRPEFRFHEWVVMPNHFHAIVEITTQNQPQKTVGTTRRSSASHIKQSNIVEITTQNQSPKTIETPHRSSASHIKHNNSQFSNQTEAINIKALHRSVIPVNKSMRPRSISSLMAGFKSTTAKQINQARKSLGSPVWQRRFYDHIIRDQASLENIRRYIINNPAAWGQDSLYASGLKTGNTDQNPSK